MRWLRDPSELADRVKRLLSKGELEKAATLTREAQRTGSACIVSWNHLIDHQMQIGKPDLAFKLYNDVSDIHPIPFGEPTYGGAGFLTYFFGIIDEEKRSKT